MSSIYKFIMLLFFYSVVLGALAFGLSWILPEKYFSPALPALFTFFFSITILIYAYLIRSKEEKFTRFVNKFMITTSLKLFIYLAILLTYIYFNKKDAVPFIISFLLLYTAYTGFEVIYFLKISRKK